jgi:hypothetical protein
MHIGPLRLIQAICLAQVYFDEVRRQVKHVSSPDILQRGVVDRRK